MEMKGHRNSSSRQPTLQGEGTSFPGGLALGHLGHFNPFDEYVLGRLRNDENPSVEMNPQSTVPVRLVRTIAR
jgi:hypothetical protein